MFDVIFMDLHHMFRTKCFWIMMLLTVLFLFLMGYMFGEVAQRTGNSEEWRMQTEEEADSDDLEEWMGPKDLSLKNLICSEAVAGGSGQTLVTLVCLFGVLFSLRERKNGFIKNTAGGIRHRWYLWVSKVVVMVVYILITFVLTILCLAISERIFDIGGDMMLDGAFFGILGVQAMLYLILSMFCITIVNLTRSAVVSVVMAFFSSSGLLMLFIAGIEEFFKIERLEIHQYLAEYQLFKMGEMTDPQADVQIFALIFGGLIFYNLINILVLRKKDIC